MENNVDHTMYRVGDIVVGNPDPSKAVYSNTGTKLTNTGVAIFGSENELLSRGKELARTAIRSGGIPVPIEQNKKTKTSKTAKKQKPSKQSSFSAEQYLEAMRFEDMDADRPRSYLPEPPSKNLTTVQFENDFGKIKAKIEDVAEHDQAFMLVFSDEDSVVFEPKVGELLALHLEGNRRVEVYYPGVTFDSPGSTKKLMILFKVPEENQD
jgi:hypothetical protein